MPRTEPSLPHQWIESLARLREEGARRQLLNRELRKAEPGLPDRLYQEVVKLARVDLVQAERVAQALAWLAAKQNEPYCRALSHRASGHVLYLTGNHAAALEEHAGALKVFEELGRELDAARSLMNQLQPLIYLGRYDEAYAVAERARQIFRKHGDTLRLARLDSNAGNILYRQDRFAEALQLYQQAYDVLKTQGDTQDVAIVLRNLAVCFISLNRFADALATYRDAREYCHQHELPLLVAECDYNIAYLHYLRGDYTLAIRLYQTTRALCEKLSDRYHTALCDLDLSELYLELNLSEEGFELACQAQAGFDQLHMGYEAAKAVTFQAIAASQQGKAQLALREFERARKLFDGERNQLWPALIRLYEALVLEDAKEYPKARRLCERALRYFRNSPSLAKTALCNLLLARIDLREKDWSQARRHCTAALDLLRKAESPAADFQAQVVRGEIEEAAGSSKSAYDAFHRAHTLLEGLRNRLLSEELKISFLKDKLSVYESLVWLLLSQSKQPTDAHRRAFEFVERAKSRSLADLISFSLQAVQPKVEAGLALAGQVDELRLRLTLAYRQVQQEEMTGKQTSSSKILAARRQFRDCEDELAGVSSNLRAVDEDFAALLNAGIVGLDEIQAVIPAGSTLLEYYITRGQICACILTRKSLKIVPLAGAGRVREVFRLLQFQLSKFRLGRAYLERFAASLQGAVNAHLEELYTTLLAPIRPRLTGTHLTIVPHGFLHYLPYHALIGDGRPLVEDFSVSYAPSASVFALCAGRPRSALKASLVFGIPDPQAPRILEEAQTVAGILPSARLCLGDQATQEVLWEHGPKSRYLHIATHGLFRQDNPMFSSIRLGPSELNLYDLYRLRLSSELVTLSGCGTGLNVVLGGDELLGLVRGLLYAGAQAVLVTLWDVNDESTAQFMKIFYRALQANMGKASALRHAMLELRQLHPHPYFWAPFALIGQPE